VGEVADYKI